MYTPRYLSMANGHEIHNGWIQLQINKRSQKLLFTSTTPFRTSHIIDNLLTPLAEFQKLLDRPKLKRVAGWCARVLEWRPVEYMISAFLVHVVGVLFSVMLGDPFVDLFKDRAGILGRGVPVRVVEVLHVPETHLLSASYTLKPARTVRNLKVDGLDEAYLSLFWILRAKGALSFPLIWSKAARENASSSAIVAPLADVGRNVWAESPIWTTLALGETHDSLGLRHISLNSTTPSDGVSLMSSLIQGAQPSTKGRASLGSAGLAQSSEDFPVS